MNIATAIGHLQGAEIYSHRSRVAITRGALEGTGHKTEAVYRRYAITSEADLREGVDRLNEATGTKRGDKAGEASGTPAQQSA